MVKDIQQGRVGEHGVAAAVSSEQQRAALAAAGAAAGAVTLHDWQLADQMVRQESTAGEIKVGGRQLTVASVLCLAAARPACLNVAPNSGAGMQRVPACVQPPSPQLNVACMLHGCPPTALHCPAGAERG